MIKFWECPSHCNWFLHKVIGIETKLFNPIPLFPSKSSWNFSKKKECNELANRWKMIFQASDMKGKSFLNLTDSDDKTIKPTYIKGSTQLKYFSHSNSLCARALRVITNHSPISKYRLRFFLREDFSCLCRLYHIESRRHILHECRRFNEYWNLRRDSIGHFVMFLELNPNVFTFTNSIS